MTDEQTDRSRRERDMVLSPNEFMFVSDQTKGNVDVFVGPTKQSLSGTDMPVTFDERTKRFKEADFATAKQLARTAPEGWYVVLKNPAQGDKQPQGGGGKMSSAPLEVGRKVNMPGPVSLFLWPGQMAKVLKGHHLRSNQYLLVRVYDEAAAQANWKSAVVKLADPSATASALPKADKLTMGQVLVIRGTDVAFYIPPTGVEVMADSKGALVRDAVTLERLEYCMLMDESGGKRYERGPAVVFPEPTEVFVERDGSRKARAIELNENSGLYVKVIADYTEGEGNGSVEYHVGDELFITGTDQMIYFPREEHAIIKYGKSEKHYGIAIPSGEARYVLDTKTGEFPLVVGPKVFLPDPRHQVIVRRILDAASCAVLYPGNQAVLAENARLAGKDPATYAAMGLIGGVAGVLGASGAFTPQATGPQGPQGGPMWSRGRADEVSSNMLYASAAVLSNSADERGLIEAPSKAFTGDAFDRSSTYTPPRTITLATKFEGAVSVDVWTGYAMMLVRKSGERRVVIGPKTVLLDYDELPQVLQLSSGKPKSGDMLVRTAFLRVLANWVTDIVEVEAKDFCKLRVKLSYRLNFESATESGAEKWFSVENYVKHLCDHMRSKLRAQVQRLGVEEFYGDHASIIRDVVLGKTDGTVARTGTVFPENGMRVYDVEVLGIEMLDAEIARMMAQSQRQTVASNLQLVAQQKALEFTRESERIRQEEAVAKAATEAKALALREEQIANRLSVELAEIDAAAKRAAEQSAREKEAEDLRSIIASIVLAREVRTAETELMLADKRRTGEIRMIEAEVKALVDRAAAVSPGLISALGTFGEQAMVEKVAESMAPMAIIGGDSVVDVLRRLLAGTPLAKHLLAASPNGAVVGAAE